MKTDRTYLLHIQECIQQIETYTRDGREVFLQSRLIQDAVVRNFEIIGEASKRLSPAPKQQHPTIPWKQVAGFRDVLIHDLAWISRKSGIRLSMIYPPSNKPLYRC